MVAEDVPSLAAAGAVDVAAIAKQVAEWEIKCGEFTAFEAALRYTISGTHTSTLKPSGDAHMGAHMNSISCGCLLLRCLCDFFWAANSVMPPSSCLRVCKRSATAP